MVIVGNICQPQPHLALMEKRLEYAVVRALQQPRNKFENHTFTYQKHSASKKRIGAAVKRAEMIFFHQPAQFTFGRATKSYPVQPEIRNYFPRSHTYQKLWLTTGHRKVECYPFLL